MMIIRVQWDNKTNSCDQDQASGRANGVTKSKSDSANSHNYSYDNNECCIACDAAAVDYPRCDEGQTLYCYYYGK